MIDPAELWEIEQNFWLSDARHFTETLAENCVMVFPSPAGILTGHRIVESLKGMPRWAHIGMTDRVFVPRDSGVVTLAYRAEAQREGQEPYRAFCGSTYTGENGNWQLLQHQQTPVE